MGDFPLGHIIPKIIWDPSHLSFWVRDFCLIPFIILGTRLLSHPIYHFGYETFVSSHIILGTRLLSHPIYHFGYETFDSSHISFWVRDKSLIPYIILGTRLLSHHFGYETFVSSHISFWVRDFIMHTSLQQQHTTQPKIAPS